MIKSIIVLLFLIGLNCLFSLALASVRTANIHKIKLEDGAKAKKAARIKGLLEKPEKFVFALQTAMTIMNMIIGVFTAFRLSPPIIGFFDQTWHLSGPAFRFLAWVLTLGAVCGINLVLGTSLPELIAKRMPEKIIVLVALPAMVLSRIFFPLYLAAGFLSRIFLKIFSRRLPENPKNTEDEIRQMVDEKSETNELDDNEIEMIHNIFEFDDKTAEEVATHRTDIKAIDVEDSLSEVLAFIETGSHSRLPVYQDSIDNILGVLHVRDMLNYLAKNRGWDDDQFDIKQLMRAPYFVPTAKKADELFKEMQLNKVHMAIVVDEYGGLSGLVTMEDLIEEIMGNIFDEYDEEEEPEIFPLDERTFIISGSAPLEDVSKALDVPLPEEEYDTAAGFVIGLLKRIPEDTERPEVVYNGYLFRVEQVEEKRITRIWCQKTETLQEE